MASDDVSAIILRRRVQLWHNDGLLPEKCVFDRRRMRTPAVRIIITITIISIIYE